MNATDAVRSGDAAGRFVFGSRNENTNRLGPGTWRELTMTGMTLAVAALVDGAGRHGGRGGAAGGRAAGGDEQARGEGDEEEGRAAHAREGIRSGSNPPPRRMGGP